MTTIKAEVTVEYLIPRPANYIKTADGRTVPVGNISEDALREIGKVSVLDSLPGSMTDSVQDMRGKNAFA